MFITNNSISGSGAGICLSGNTYFIISKCLISNNNSSSGNWSVGGGIYASNTAGKSLTLKLWKLWKLWRGYTIER